MISFGIGDKLRCRDRLAPPTIHVNGDSWESVYPDFIGTVKNIDGRTGLVVIERQAGVTQTISIGLGDVLEKIVRGGP